MTKKLVSWKSFMKYIMVFALGIFFTFAITNGYTVIKSTVQNAVQFIKETVFTDSWLDTGTRLMDINAGDRYIWINTWALHDGTGWNTRFLALDESWMVIYAPEGDPIFSGSPAGTITLGNINNWNSTYNRINNSGNTLRNRYVTTGNYATNWVINNSTWALTNYYTTSFSFNSWTNILTLNVSGYGPVTGYVIFSGMNNRNNAYSWVTNTGANIANRYNSTGINVNALATAILNCSPGELVKYNWSAWVCSGDLVWGGSSLWTWPAPLLTPIQAGEVKLQVGENAQTIWTHTIALWRSTVANWDYSVAIWSFSQALWTSSLSLWSNAIASWYHAVALWTNTTANGDYSLAMGESTIASWTTSTAMGSASEAHWDVSIAMGQNSIANGTRSIAMGTMALASGTASTAIGNGPHALGNNSVAMWVATIADWTNSTAMGDTTHAVGDNSTAMGVWTTASWTYSTAMGRHTTASWTYSTAMGNVTQANWANSTAMGSSTHANWYTSTAMGRHTHANWYASTAMGNQTVANSTWSLAIGSFNIWYPTSVFEIWIGVNSTTNSWNAMIVRNSGDITFPMLPNYPCIGTDSNGTLISVSCGSGSSSGDSLWAPNGAGDIYNKNLTGKVSVGLTNPTVDFQVSGNVIVWHPSNNNINSSTYAFIFWDRNNIIGGNQSHIGWSGGMVHNSNFSTIAGGEGNTIQTRDHSFIWGGTKNIIDCWNYYTLGDKDELTPVFDWLCIIGWWSENIISGSSSLSFIWAGLQNNIKSASFASNIVWGAKNTISGIGDGTWYLSSIVWWYGNSISGFARLGFIWGGQSWTIDDSTHSFIWGWLKNHITTSNKSFVWGWETNTISWSSLYSFIWGGNNNHITTSYRSFIWWGQSNTITSIVWWEIAWSNTIVGWLSNIISGYTQYNFIWGWNSNAITWTSSYSTIPWGRSNLIDWTHNSFAAGRNAQALHNYSFVWNDSATPFSTMKDNTFIIHSSAGVGINTNDIATGVDIEINEVMRLKPQTIYKFDCNEGNEGSVFMYKAWSKPATVSYLCYCGYGWVLGDVLMWRRVSDDEYNGQCGNPPA